MIPSCSMTILVLTDLLRISVAQKFFKINFFLGFLPNLLTLHQQQIILQPMIVMFLLKNKKE